MNNISETEFHRLADATLDRLFSALEAADEQAMLDVEHEGDIITIKLPSGKQFIVSKHRASRQLWLSSPVSGGLHFTHQGQWVLADGRNFEQVMLQELQALANISVTF